MNESKKTKCGEGTRCTRPGSPGRLLPLPVSQPALTCCQLPQHTNGPNRKRRRTDSMAGSRRPGRIHQGQHVLVSPREYYCCRTGGRLPCIQGYHCGRRRVSSRKNQRYSAPCSRFLRPLRTLRNLQCSIRHRTVPLSLSRTQLLIPPPVGCTAAL